MFSCMCFVNRGLYTSPWLAKYFATTVVFFVVSDVKEMTLKPIKYYIFGLTHILDMANIAFQAIY